MLNPQIVVSPQSLTVAFIAALALQHLTELLDSLVNLADPTAKKKLFIGVSTLIVAGVIESCEPSLRVLAVFIPKVHPTIDTVITALIVSAGTDGFNSILKFANYKKEDAKTAGNEVSQQVADGAAALTLPAPALQ
jgi:hypothetical protein